MIAYLPIIAFLTVQNAEVSLGQTIVKTSCSSTTVEEGQKAELTCYFDHDVSKLQQNLKVELYANYSSQNPESVDLFFNWIYPETVLSCGWQDTTPTCVVASGYMFDYVITNTTRLQIPRTSSKHVGRYACFVLPSSPGFYQLCNLTLKQVSVTEVLTSTTTFGKDSTGKSTTLSFYIIFGMLAVTSMFS